LEIAVAETGVPKNSESITALPLPQGAGLARHGWPTSSLLGFPIAFFSVRREGKTMRLLVPLEAEDFAVRRKRKLEIERIRLEAEKKDLDERCRVYFSNNPVPHNPAAQYLREHGWGDPHPERSRLEGECNDWMKRWNATLNELSHL